MKFCPAVCSCLLFPATFGLTRGRIRFSMWLRLSPSQGGCFAALDFFFFCRFKYKTKQNTKSALLRSRQGQAAPPPETWHFSNPAFLFPLPLSLSFCFVTVTSFCWFQNNNWCWKGSSCRTSPHHTLPRLLPKSFDNSPQVRTLCRFHFFSTIITYLCPPAFCDFHILSNCTFCHSSTCNASYLRYLLSGAVLAEKWPVLTENGRGTPGLFPVAFCSIL